VLKSGPLAAAILGSSITFIDGTVVNVALAMRQQQLGIDIVGAQCVVKSYSLIVNCRIGF
jgi:hypothetical protein